MRVKQPWAISIMHNEDSDILIAFWEDVAAYDDEIHNDITLFRAGDDDRIVGLSIPNIRGFVGLLPEPEPDEIHTYRIITPVFAGRIKVRKGAVIRTSRRFRFMEDGRWSMHQVTRFCKKKGWQITHEDARLPTEADG